MDSSRFPKSGFSAADQDAPNLGTPTRFIAGGFAGTLAMWLVMRGTPLFNSYNRANKRLVHVLFPTWVITGTAVNVVYNRQRENNFLEKWGPNTVNGEVDTSCQLWNTCESKACELFKCDKKETI